MSAHPRREQATDTTTRTYHHVDMGRLDQINGPASYPFPTLTAAQRFADNHQARDPHRKISVRSDIK